MGDSLRLMGNSLVSRLISTDTSPFLYLFIGILATAIVQSSSFTTTIMVGLVAASQLELPDAVMMVLGANVGTSVTSTVIALGYIGKREEYGRAVSAATLHDFFNILVILVIVPFELAGGLLSGSASYLAEHIPLLGSINEGMGGLLFFLQAFSHWLLSLMSIPGYEQGLYLLVLLVSVMLMVGSLQWLSRILRQTVIGQVRRNLKKYVFGSPFKSILSGLLSTVLVQSSSVTTSLIVPLVATKKLTLERCFPFLMGANVGTTTTAFLAAIFVISDNPRTTLAVALAHVLTNLIGVFLMSPFKVVRNIPIWLARKLGQLSQENRLYGVGYVVVVFFVLPLILVLLTR